MKEIKDLTEQEILKLTDEDVQLLIKQKKAVEGIKLIECPEIPDYKDIKEKDLTLYSCGLFAEKLLFEDITDLQKVIELINSIKLKGRLSNMSEYDLFSSSTNAFYEPSLKAGYNYNCWDEIKTSKLYSFELYNSIKDDAKYNGHLKNNYESDLKEYNDAKNESEWISKEIWDKVFEVREKYRVLEMYCYKMKNEYMDIAENNEDIAIGFLIKTYSLNNEEKEYVLANYNN
jgi:hypothetical protein